MTSANIVFKWSVIGAVIYLIVGFIGYALSIETAGFMSFMLGILIAFPILMASFEYRDKFGQGFATLGQIFLQGLKITFLLALLATSWSFVYSAYINEDYLVKKQLKDKMVLQEQGLSTEQIEEAIQLSNQKVSPMQRIVIEKFIQVIIFGTFVSLVSGLVIRNEKPRPELNKEIE